MICTIGGGLELHSNFVHDAYILRANCFEKKSLKMMFLSLFKARKQNLLRKGKSHTGYRSFSLLDFRRLMLATGLHN